MVKNIGINENVMINEIERSIVKARERAMTENDTGKPECAVCSSILKRIPSSFEIPHNT